MVIFVSLIIFIDGVIMQKSKSLIFILFVIGLLITGFQCSSTELTSARLYIQQKNYEKALEELKGDVTKNPKSDDGYFLMGHVYGEMDDMANMVDNYKKSLAISNKFEKEINESKTYFWANSFNRGVTNFQRGSKTEDEDSAKIFFENAVENYKTAIIIAPDSADTYKNLSFAYLSTGKYKMAIDPLEKLIEMEDSEDGYQYLGNIYYTMGSNKMIDFRNDKNPEDSVRAIQHFNKAIDVLEKGRTMYPNNSDILVVLSNSYIGANKIDVAMDAFKAGVVAEPENKYYRYNYGVLLLGADQFVEAEEQFLKALEIDPEYSNAIYNLAVTYVKWGTAINLEAKEGSDPEAYKEKYRSALPYLEDVVESDSTNAQIWELLGKVYGVLGMNEDAENAFNKADALRQ